jgi:hypothetical protein
MERSPSISGNPSPYFGRGSLLFSSFVLLNGLAVNLALNQSSLMIEIAQSSYSLAYKTSRDSGIIASASSNLKDDHNPISFDANDVFGFPSSHMSVGPYRSLNAHRVP